MCIRDSWRPGAETPAALPLRSSPPRTVHTAVDAVPTAPTEHGRHASAPRDEDAGAHGFSGTEVDGDRGEQRNSAGEQDRSRHAGVAFVGLVGHLLDHNAG